MSWFDILILVIAGGYVWGGFWAGLIQSIGGVIGLFLGVIIASRTYESVGNFINPVFGGHEITGYIFAFLLVFMLVTRLVGLAFYFINKMFKFIAIVPGLKLLNNIGGAIFGFIEGALFIGLTLQFISHLPISNNFAELIANSALAGYCLTVAVWLVPLFPGVLKSAENMVDKFVPK